MMHTKFYILTRHVIIFVILYFIITCAMPQTGAIETPLSNCRHLLSSLSIRDIGNVLYSAIWEYTRRCPVGSEIPGLGTVTKSSLDMRAKNTTIAVEKIRSIVRQRISSPSALETRADPKFEETAKKYSYL
jgi:hypothetical protein